MMLFEVVHVQIKICPDNNEQRAREMRMAPQGQ